MSGEAFDLGLADCWVSSLELLWEDWFAVLGFERIRPSAEVIFERLEFSYDCSFDRMPDSDYYFLSYLGGSKFFAPSFENDLTGFVCG